MISIKEYAQSRNISYEAVRVTIKRYAIDLKEEIVKQGRTRYLTDTAIEFLDNHRQKHVLDVVAETDVLQEQEQTISKLKEEIIILQQRILELQQVEIKAIEDKVRLEIANEHTAKLEQEISLYKPFVFGLYRKSKA